MIIEKFLSRKKYTKLSLEEKCNIIYKSRRTLLIIRKTMPQKYQGNRNLKKKKKVEFGSNQKSKLISYFKNA